MSALGDVLDRPGHFGRLAGDRVVNDHRHFLDDSFASVGTDYSMLDAVARAVADRSCHFVPNARPIVRMHGLEEVLVRRIDLPWLVTEDAKGLIRPLQRVLVQVSRLTNVKLPAADVGEVLRRREAILAFS